MRKNRYSPRNSRDARGWCIPREGTVRRAVYELMLAGKSNAEIAAKVDRSPGYVSVTLWTIRNPEARAAGMGAKAYAQTVERARNEARS